MAATLANDLNTTDDKEGAFEAIASKQQEKLDKEEVLTEFRLSTGDDRVGQLNRALLTGNISLAVELCVEARRWADALALASTRGGDALARRTIKKYLADCAEAGADEANLIRALAVGGSGQDGGGVGGWRDFARRCAGEDWRQALAAAATYAGAEEFPEICAELGDRRAADGDGQVRERVYLRTVLVKAIVRPMAICGIGSAVDVRPLKSKIDGSDKIRN